jgi:hypothetical protein
MAEEVFELEDGTVVKKFCLTRISDGISNYETIWDVLDVVTRITKLNVIKNESGIVTDVSLVLPKIDEVVVQMALRNFETYHSIKMNDSNLSAEEVLEMRRGKLEKLIGSKL